MLRKYGWLVLIIGLALAFWLGTRSASSDQVAQSTVATSSLPQEQNLPEPTPLPSTIRVPESASLPSFLPPEAKTTLALISHRGPFPNRQDGVVFQNREQRLPKKARGYYHEYTVETPGLNHRGARRIITGGRPVEIYYYTEDHYENFRQFEVSR